MSDIFTQDIKDSMKLATTDFDKFYQETEKQNKSSGNYSKAASSGNYSKAASSGDRSTAASSGDRSACTALGYRAAVKGDIGNLLMASEYKNENGKFIPVGGKADIVDGKKLKPQCWYIVENGEWVEVDYTDGIFNYVLHTRGNIKKLQSEQGKSLYLATDGEYSAHGDTIKEALEELAFKVAERDVSQYKGMKLTTKKTPEEWALVYRACTGACRYGTKDFMGRKKLKKTYTLKEILEETKGAYGHERFKEAVR